MNAQQVAQQAYDAGFRGASLVTATAIALAESGGNPSANGDQGTSFGLWQVHIPAHPQYTQSQLVDPVQNANAAFAISGGGANFNPWSTFTNGAYKKYEAQAQQASSSISGNSMNTQNSTTNITGSLGSFGKWALAFGVLAATLLLMQDNENTKELGAAFGGVIALYVATTHGPAAWNELKGALGA